MHRAPTKPSTPPARSRLRAIDLLLERCGGCGRPRSSNKQASAQQFGSCFPSLNDAFHYTVPSVNILFTYTHPAGLLKADQRAPSDERATFSAQTNLISICFRVCVCACLCVPFLPVHICTWHTPNTQQKKKRFALALCCPFWKRCLLGHKLYYSRAINSFITATDGPRAGGLGRGSHECVQEHFSFSGRMQMDFGSVHRSGLGVDGGFLWHHHDTTPRLCCFEGLTERHDEKSGANAAHRSHGSNAI